MAQWIPKTAWKVTNLNKRYGQQYVTRGTLSSNAEHSLVSYASATHQEETRDEVLKSFMERRSAPENPLPGTCFIDVRDDAERRQFPLSSELAVPLHPHDILSGAANPLLPWQKEKSELFVISSSSQRAVNALAALRRWGYRHSHVIDYDAATELFGAIEGTSGDSAKQQTE